MGRGLVLYDTMSMRKEKFGNPRKVKMFVCGPTVQNFIHVGHARTYVFYDVLARYLAHMGCSVEFLMNITDIDDRITHQARERGVDPESMARKYTTAFLEDVKRLRIGTVSRFEPVSKYVDVMKNQVSSLLEGGHAYLADGVVYFDTSTFPRYGELSHQSKGELSLRPLELSPNKRNLLDFALWRPVVLLEGKWESPWGRGSPGWHIQDTAVTLTNFGAQYDIHGGAYELIYPHHEAEIAEAESITNVRPLVRFWVHTGLVNTRKRKMSKTAGNALTVKSLLRRCSASQLRFYLLSTHYRKDIEFDLHGLDREKRRFSRVAKRAREITKGARTRTGTLPQEEEVAPLYRALDDDLDTPKALRWIQETVDAVSDPESARGDTARSALSASSNLLGIDFFR